MAAKAANYRDSDLSESHKAALRLSDLLMSQPTDIDDAFATELRTHFSESQIIELTLDVMKWNYQKVAVALRVDAEVNPGELTDLHFDADGHWLRPTT